MDLRPNLPSSENFDRLVATPVSTSSEATAAAGELAKESSLTATTTFYGGKKIYDFRATGEKTPAAELKKQYPEYADILGQDQHPAMAEMMVEREKKRRELEAIVEGGPKGFWQGTKEFGAGMGAMLSDPMEATINVGGMLLTGGLSSLARVGAWGLGKIGLEAAGEAAIRTVGKETLVSGAESLAAKTLGAKAVKSGLSTTAAQFGLSAAENAVVTGASVGSDMLAANEGGREFTAGEAAGHVAMNVGIGGVLHGVTHGLGRVLKSEVKMVPKGEPVLTGEPGQILPEQPTTSKVVYTKTATPPDAGPMAALPDNVVERIAKNSETAINEGRVIDHAAEKGQLIKETFNDGGGQYQYDPAKDVRRAPLYGATEVSVSDLRDGPSVPVGDFLGDDVIQLTDNPHAAEKLAARGDGEVAGSHFRAELDPTAKLFDMSDEDSLTQPIRDKFEAARANGDITAMNEIRDELRAAGYDGIKHNGGKFLGEEAPNQHTVGVWNKEKVITREAFNGDITKQVVPTPEEVRARLNAEADPKNKITYNPEAKKMLDQVEAMPESKLTPSESRERLQEINEQLKSEESRGAFTKEEIAAIENEAMVERANLKKEQKIWRSLINCKVGK